MDENKLRHLEKQYKLRVKTGCGTCRIRRVKCDETQPACLRCTKTGRTCDGYAHLVNTAQNNHGAAASYRNSSFLVVPQRSAIVRNPSRSLSPNPKENRSFEYFQTRTLPMWTEFFNSELWSRTVLQLSHDAPAIKHGILAISIMHERFEGVVPISTADSRDFALSQYMLAVQHSNQLLTAFQQGKASLAMVLTACIIFTCYENLAGNYGTAKMHLRNGLRILDQHKSEVGIRGDANLDAITQSMYRFDLEAMSFSDDAAPYEYSLDLAPVCPIIADSYTSNATARDDLIGVLRCMMWLSGISDRIPTAPQHSEWVRLHRDMSSAIRKWETTFATYQKHISPEDQTDARMYAGNTLLKMGALIIRVIVGAGGGNGSEMAWDAFVDSFRTVVDLADTLPILRAPAHGISSPSYSTTRAKGPRRIAPNPASTPSLQSTTSSTFVFRAKPDPSPSPHQPSTPTPRDIPSSFSPSFELSPIVPLFLTACRCRDPIIRRRAISHLLRYRRREGVWDSLGAGMVALQCMLREENISTSPGAPLNYENADTYLGRNPGVQIAADVHEEARVRYIFVKTEVVRGKTGIVYQMTGGGKSSAQQVFWENRHSE